MPTCRIALSDIECIITLSSTHLFLHWVQVGPMLQRIPLPSTGVGGDCDLGVALPPGTGGTLSLVLPWAPSGAGKAKVLVVAPPGIGRTKAMVVMDMVWSGWGVGRLLPGLWGFAGWDAGCASGGQGLESRALWCFFFNVISRTTFKLLDRLMESYSILLDILDFNYNIEEDSLMCIMY